MKKLFRSDDRVVSGVCGGVAEYVDIDPVVIRVIYAVVGVFTIPLAIVLYIALSVIIPAR